MKRGTYEEQQIYADWLDEQDAPHADKWRHGLATFCGLVIGNDNGRGDTSSIGGGAGSHRGNGGGDGSCSGSGGGGGSGMGRGRGRGSFSDDGSSIGSALAGPIDSGRGSHWDRGYATPTKGENMIPGSNYLVHGGDWHTFVATYVGPSECGPLLYEFADVLKIENTNNGDNWGQLAMGDQKARDAATYQRYGDTAYMPVSILAVEWKGDLPEASK